MDFDSEQSIADTLRAAASEGTTVELRLLNGQTLGGKVGSVGDRAIVIESITGKEFFDAFVRLDHVTAIEVRVRG